MLGLRPGLPCCTWTTYHCQVGGTMNQAELKKEWLTNNALLAFVVALLMGAAWQASDRTVRILFVFTVPDHSEWGVLAIIAALFLLSLFLSMAALFQRVAGYAVRWRALYSRALGFLLWFIFLFSWMSLGAELPTDQWWTPFLLLGGIWFSVFIPLRALLSRSRQ